MIKDRTKLREVMQRAALLDLSELVETDLLRGVGRRDSPATSTSGLGRMVSVVDYTTDHDFSDINWNLSAQSFPRRKLIIKRERLIRRDWAIVVGCGPTMDFGTTGDLKLITGLQLAATFAQAALKKRDRVAQIVFDEKRVVAFEDASVEEMVLMSLAQSNPGTRRSSAKDKLGRGGLSFALTQLPENSAIVPVVWDFMNMTKAEKTALAQAARFHKVLCCVVEDAREIGFPKVSGQITLQDITSGRHETMTFAQADKLVSQDRAARLAELFAFFRKHRISYACFEGGEATPVTRKKLIRLLQSGA